MKFTLLGGNIIKYLIILISVIFMVEIAYYGDNAIKSDYNFVEEEIQKKAEDKASENKDIYIEEQRELLLLKEQGEYIPGNPTEISNFLQNDHISEALINPFLYVALFSIIILTLLSIGIGSSIGALFSFILLYWGKIDYGNIPYLTNGDLFFLNDGIPDSSVMDLFQTIMVILTLIISGDVIEKIINKRRDLIFARIKMILPLGLIILISYGLSINTSSSSPTIVKFVESKGTILPANAIEYYNLTDAEQKSWSKEGRITRKGNEDINWDHVEIVEAYDNLTDKDKIDDIITELLSSKLKNKELINLEEFQRATQVIQLNELREEENMVGMAIWSFYILLGIAIILIIITELLSSKLEFIISTVSRKSSK